MISIKAAADVELDTLLSVVSWVFDRLTAFITFANNHHSIWVPVGFSIAAMTIYLFKSALNVPTNKNF